MGRYRVRVDSENGSEARLRPVTVGSGLPSVDALHDELQSMYDVLLDRAKAPIDYNSTIALLEVADAFYSRASEIKFMIYHLERTDPVKARHERYPKFRTGELDTFLDSCKRSADTGSRRLSAQQFEFEKSVRGLNSWGGSSPLSI